MPWYDESLAKDPDAIVEGEELHSSRISRVRHGDNAGSSGYGPDNFADLSVEEQDIAMTHYEGGEGANCFCFGLRGRRRGRSGADDFATGGAIVGDDFVTLQLLEDALTKYSATHRRPSTAHVDLLERRVALKARMFGPENCATRRALRDAVVACNSLAMLALGRGDASRCNDLLLRALETASDGNRGHRNIDASCESEGGLSRGIPALQVLTFNNMACLHRRLGEPKRSLRLLSWAAGVGRQSNSSEHLEVTHLNACAVLSELGRHEEALEHARSAVFFALQREGIQTQSVGEASGEGILTRLGECKSTPARVATLAVSCYNLAVELEHTHRYEACLRWYQKALMLVCHPDVRNEELMKTFQRAYTGARKKRPPYKPMSLGGRRASSAKTLARGTGRHASETTTTIFSPSRGRSLRRFPLSDVVHQNGDSDDNGHQAISPTSFAGVDGARRIKLLEARGDSKGWQQGVELPNLGQIKKQRATRRDERQSKEADNLNRIKPFKQPLESLASPQYDIGETPLLLQRRRGCAARGKDLAVQARRPSVKGVVCAGDSRFGPSGQRTDPRKISKSVEISKNLERVQVGRGSYAAVIPGATKPFLGPISQSPGGKSGDSSVFDRKCHVETEASIGGDLHQQQSVDSRRPKSVYPRLEEDTQPAISRRSRADIGARGGGAGDMRAKPVRSRSASTLLEGSASRLALSTCGDIAFDGEYRSLEPSRELEVEVESCNNALDGKERSSGKRCNRLMARAKLPRTRAGSGGVNGADQDGGNSRPISRSSSLEVSCRRRRRSVKVPGVASSLANEPKVRQIRTLANGGKPAIERVVPNVLCANSLLIPRASIDSRTQKSLEGRLELENGCHGKLYVETRQQKVDETTASFMAEDNTCGNRCAYTDREKQEGDATDFMRVHGNRYIHWDNASWSETAMGAASTIRSNVTNVQVDSIKTKGSAKHIDATVPSLLGSTRRAAAARLIRRAGLRTTTRRRKGQVRRGDEEDDDDLMLRSSEVSSVYETVSSKGEGTDQVLAVTEHDASKQGESRAEVATNAILPRATTSITTTKERRSNLSRTTRDRRILAGSTIRVWAARSLLARRLRSRRFADIEFRWEHEVRRIAATRIQSVVRGMEVRRECERGTRFGLEIQRLARGRAGRLITERKFLKKQRSLEEHREVCDHVESLFQDHRERRLVFISTERERERERQILREEVIVYNGAAAIIQGFWRHHKNRKLLLRHANPIEKLSKKPKKTAGTATQTSTSTPSTPTLRESSSPLASLIGVRPFSPAYRPPPQGINNGTCSPLPLDTQPTMPDAFLTLKSVAPAQKPWRPTEAEMSSLYVVWNAFTALLTTFAMRRATKTKLVRALLTPAAITLATFSRVHRAACISLEGASTSRTGASLVVSPDHARFHCARSVERDITVAGWRLAEAARIHAESLLAAQSEATKAIGGLRTADIDAAKKYAREAVLEAVQKSWEGLHSSMDLLGDAAELNEKMLQTLSDTAQDLFVDLTSIPLKGLMAQAGADKSVIDHVECSDGIVRARSPRQDHQVSRALPDTIARVLASSAAGTLLSHPDVLEILNDTGEELETLEYASLVAEACGVLLLVTPPINNLSEGHHGETDRDQTKNTLGTPPHEELRGDACLQHGATKPPVLYPARSPFRSNLRAHERLGFLRLIVDRIDATADELVRAMELQVSPRPPEGHSSAFGPSDMLCQGVGEREGCGSDFSCPRPRYQELLLVRSMTDRLWDLAWSVSPLPMDDKQAHESYRERA